MTPFPRQVLQPALVTTSLIPHLIIKHHDSFALINDNRHLAT